MATTDGFRDYILEKLGAIGDITVRRMMGEYCVYYRGKLIGDICEDTLLLKPVASVLRLLPDAERAYPYEGSKTLMVVADRFEDTELMREVIEAMYPELPEPKKKRTAAAKESRYAPLWRWIAENGTEKFTLTFDEIADIIGAPIDHAFLKYKKELTEYGYRVVKVSLKGETVSFEKV